MINFWNIHQNKLIVLLILTWFLNLGLPSVVKADNLLKVKSIDTMKYSRDLAREKLNDQNFSEVIDKQVALIAQTGATHVAIGTPYDREFLPFLKKWVASTRKYKLNVWYRGNFSGWEEWFDYPKMNRNEHTSAIRTFIRTNADLFQNGDIFTSCPECENGGPGSVYDDVKGHRTFLISEYRVVKQIFAGMGKQITANYYSMNGDIAKLVMDKPTTRSMDGIVTVDHYVKTVDQLESDISKLAEQSGGKVVLGELGAPIPDIHRIMNEQEQAEWLGQAFAGILRSPAVVGVNYWVGIGGSTAIWSDTGKPRKAVEVLRYAYNGSTIQGKVIGTDGKLLAGAEVQTLGEIYKTDTDGIFTIPLLHSDQKLRITAKDYRMDTEMTISASSGGVRIIAEKNPVVKVNRKLLRFFFAHFISLMETLKGQ